MPAKNSRVRHEFIVSVLGYMEEGRYVAHCLEFDIRGWGDSPEEALVVLNEMLAMQISFAVQFDELDLLDRPADERYLRAFNEHRRREFINSFRRLGGLSKDTSMPPSESEETAYFLPLHQSELKGKRNQYRLASCSG
jgi:hypothetical protein